MHLLLEGCPSTQQRWSRSLIIAQHWHFKQLISPGKNLIISDESSIWLRRVFGGWLPKPGVGTEGTDAGHCWGWGVRMGMLWGLMAWREAGGSLSGMGRGVQSPGLVLQEQRAEVQSWRRALCLQQDTGQRALGADGERVGGRAGLQGSSGALSPSTDLMENGDSEACSSVRDRSRG